MKIVLTIIAVLLFCASAQGALVTVTDTLYTANGETWAGRIEVSWDAFTTAAGVSIPKGSKTYTITAGAVSAALEPNQGATPSGTAYTVRWIGTRARWSETWVIPVSATPVTLATIRKSSTLVVYPSQLDQASATDAQCLTWSTANSRWQPGACAEGEGGAVTSVAGRTGAVVLAASDIANTPAGAIAAVTVQAALNELDTEKVATTDARLTDARTPAAHAASHASGQADALSGTLAVDISGNAATATSATSATSATTATTASAAPWAGITDKPASFTPAAHAAAHASGQADALSGTLAVDISGNAATATSATSATSATTASALAGQYIDWAAVNGATSIANKPTLGTAAAKAAVESVGAPGSNDNVPTEAAVRSAIAAGGGGTVSPEVAVYVAGDMAVFKSADGNTIGRPALTGIPYLTSGALGSATSTNVIALWASGLCSGYLKSDGTCDTPTGTGDVQGAANLTTSGRVVTVSAAGTVTEQSAVTVAAGVVTATGFSGPLTGNATTATTASAAPWAGITDKPATFAPASHNNTAHSETYITTAGVTYEALSGNSDVGTGASQVAAGDHTHAALHTQNTDTGTTATSFQIDSGNTGFRIKNEAGAAAFRNAADDDYVDLIAKTLSTSGAGTSEYIFTKGVDPAAPAAGKETLFIDSADDLMKLIDSASALRTIAFTTSNVATATALAADPAGCTNQFTRDINASGTATCASVAGTDFATQAANQVFAGPTGGGAAAPAFRALVGADLPNPAVGTKGGVTSLTCSGTDKVSAIGTDGIPVCSADQTAAGGAAFSDITTGSNSTATMTVTTGASIVPSGSGIIRATTVVAGSSVASFMGPTAPRAYTFPDADKTIMATDTAVALSQLPATARVRSVGAHFLSPTTDSIQYVPVGYACTVYGWEVSVVGGTTPTATIDVLRVADGTALPTLSITGTGTKPNLAANARNRAGSVDWVAGGGSVSIAQYDMLGFDVTAVSGSPTSVQVVLYCLI